MEKKDTNNGTKTIKERLEGVTVTDSEGVSRPVYAVIEEATNSEIEKVANKEISSKSVGINQPTTSKFNTNLSRARSERRDYTEKFSPEELAHANFLFHSQGGKTMEPLQGNSSFSPTQEGGIEGAVRDAIKKEKFYAAEVQRNQLEQAKWAAIKTQLQAALDILSGKTTAQGEVRVRTASSPKGVWWGFVKDKILIVNGPVSKKELYNFLVEKGCSSSMAAYQAIRNMIKTERLREVDESKVELGPNAD